MTGFGQGTLGRRALSAMLAYALMAAAPASASVPSAGVAPGTLVANGSVRALTHFGDVTYLGGDFTRIGPRTGSGTVLDRDGTLVGGFPEIAGGAVRVAIGDGDGGWYVGGSFTSPRAGLLHLRSDGSLDPAVALTVKGGEIRSLALDGGTLYVGGSFTRLAARSRAGLAAVDVASGAVEDWDAAPEGGSIDALAVQTVTLSTAGRTRPVSVVVAGGSFTKVGGTDAMGLAVLWGDHARDGEDGAKLLAAGMPAGSPAVRAVAVGPVKANATDSYLTVYDATAPGPLPAAVEARRLHVVTASAAADLAPAQSWSFTLAAGASPRALALSPKALYVGGDGLLLAKGAITDPETGGQQSDPPAFDKPPDGSVQALALDGDRLLAGGAFGKVGDTVRDRLAAFALADGKLTAWDPRVAGGDVGVLAVSGDRAFAGGDFTTVNTAVRGGLAAVDAAGRLTGFAPDLGSDPRVYALATDGTTVWAGGVFAGSLAALDAATGAPRGGFAPAVSGSAAGVLALALREGVLYVGGGFDQIGGAARANLAALDPASGAALGFRADADQPVRALLAGCGSLYAGGSFEAIGGAARARLAELDPLSGTVRAWDPGASSAVYALARGDGVIYAGGQFSSAGGKARGRLAALDVATGAATDFDPSPDVAVRALAAGAGALYVGGSFNHAGGADRSRLAALDPATGAALDWNPAPDERIWALDLQPGGLAAGGDFRSVSGGPQQGLAHFGGDADLAGAERCPEPPRAAATAPAVAPAAEASRLGAAFKPAKLKRRRVDRTRPALRLSFRRGRLVVRLSEPAALTVRLERRVHRRWRLVRSLTRRAGSRTVIVRLRRLPRGRLRVVVRARDRAGNRSLAARLAVRR